MLLITVLKYKKILNVIELINYYKCLNGADYSHKRWLF